MTDPFPSNQWGVDEAFKTLESITEGSSAAKGALRFLRHEITRLREDCRRWENARNVWMAEEKRLKAQVEELSIHAEKWVKRALGGAHTCARALAESAYKDGYGADLTDDRDLSDRTHGLVRSLSRPAHEREPPHCSSCACGMGNPLEKVACCFAGKVKDSYILKLWFESQEDLDAAFNLIDEAAAMLPMVPIDNSTPPPGDGQ